MRPSLRLARHTCLWLSCTSLMLFLALKAGAASPRSAETSGAWTLAAALSLYRVRGFDILMAQTAVDSARADETIAGAVVNPALSGTVGKTFRYDPNRAGGCAGCSGLPWSLGLSDSGALLDVLSGKRELRRRIARTALSAAKLSQADAHRTLELLLKQRYLDAVLAEEARANADETARLAERTLDLINTRYRLGAVSEADSAKVETAKLQADQAVDAANQSVALARTALAFMVGVPVLGTEVRLDRGLLHRPLSDRIDTPSRDQLVSHTLAYRPDVNAAISQRDSASAAAALNRRQLFPSISLSAQYSQEGTGQDAIQPPTVIVGASLPLPLFYQYQGEIDKADAAVRAQTIDLHRIEAQVIADIDSSLANLAAAQSRVQRMESRLLDRAARTQELVQVQYEKGAASLLELLDAQRTFIGTRADYLQDLANYWGAVFALEAATGMELIK